MALGLFQVPDPSIKALGGMQQGSVSYGRRDFGVRSPEQKKSAAGLIGTTGASAYLGAKIGAATTLGNPVGMLAGAAIGALGYYLF